jgi:hypothetical protein
MGVAKSAGKSAAFVSRGISRHCSSGGKPRGIRTDRSVPVPMNDSDLRRDVIPVPCKRMLRNSIYGSHPGSTEMRLRFLEYDCESGKGLPGRGTSTPSKGPDCGCVRSRAQRAFGAMTISTRICTSLFWLARSVPNLRSHRRGHRAPLFSCHRRRSAQ